MALNLSSGGGSFTPSLRWSSQTSSWQLTGEQGEGLKTIQLGEFIADLENIATGWGTFPLGGAPQWVMDQSMTQPAGLPDDRKDDKGKSIWKRGFKLKVYSPAQFGGDGIRELAMTATGACMAVDLLHDQFEKLKGANAGKVPVVTYKGATPTKIGKGASNVPNLEIVKFVDRPAALGATTASLHTTAPSALQQVAQSVQAPVAAQAVSEF